MAEPEKRGRCSESGAGEGGQQGGLAAVSVGEGVEAGAEVGAAAVGEDAASVL